MTMSLSDEAVAPSLLHRLADVVVLRARPLRHGIDPVSLSRFARRSIPSARECSSLARARYAVTRSTSHSGPGRRSRASREGSTDTSRNADEDTWCLCCELLAGALRHRPAAGRLQGARYPELRASYAQPEIILKCPLQYCIICSKCYYGGVL